MTSSAIVVSSSISQSIGGSTSQFLKTNSEETIDFEFSIAVLGDDAVGKSTLIRQELEINSADNNIKGDGIRFHRKTYYSMGYNVSVQLWDCPGNQIIYQEHLTRLCAGCAGVILVYDVARMESFQYIDDLVSEIRKNGAQINIAIVANMIDKPGRSVSREEGEHYSDIIRASIYQETSILKGEGIREIFNPLVTSILKSLPSPLEPMSLLRRNIKFNDRVFQDKNTGSIARSTYQQEGSDSTDATAVVDWIK